MKKLNFSVVCTDGLRIYDQVIDDDCLIQNKGTTRQIERNNSNTRHYFARFNRKTKVVSRSEDMIDIALLFQRCIIEGNLFIELRNKILSIFN